MLYTTRCTSHAWAYSNGSTEFISPHLAAFAIYAGYLVAEVPFTAVISIAFLFAANFSGANGAFLFVDIAVLFKLVAVILLLGITD